MEILFFKNGCIFFGHDNCEVDSIEITKIEAEYSADRENLIGIRRLSYLDIYPDNHIVMNSAKSMAFNNLCEVEYNDNNEHWRNNAIDDLCKYFELSNDKIIIK